MNKMLKNIEIRNIKSNFQTRDDGTNPIIEGYFAVFNEKYEMFPKFFEMIDEHAFDETLEDDVRALIDHDTRLVLGRNKANTLTLKVDKVGLFGEIKVNPNDSEAMNLYARVQRGDVSQCSFGFEILEEDSQIDGDETLSIVKKLKLYEVSVCTFPAYESTAVTARKKHFESEQQKKKDMWRSKMLQKLKGENKPC